MANEIQISWTARIVKGSLSLIRAFNAQFTLNAAAPNVAGLTKSIPTTAAGTALGLGSVATNGVGYFVNTDAANYVELGIQQGGTFYPFLRLNAGEGFPVRVAQGVAPYARANTAAVVLEYAICDD